VKTIETFLTQTGPTLPLTPDPPVICIWKWKGWKDYEVKKMQFGERLCQKRNFFFTRRSHTRPLYPPGPPTFTLPAYPTGPPARHARRPPAPNTSTRLRHAPSANGTATAPPPAPLLPRALPRRSLLLHLGNAPAGRPSADRHPGRVLRRRRCSRIQSEACALG
jgi:hypothetical protein